MKGSKVIGLILGGGISFLCLLPAKSESVPVIGLFQIKDVVEVQYNDLFSLEKRPNIDFLNVFSGEKVNKELPFSNGEKIMFSIQKMGLKVGEATLVFQGSAKLGEKRAALIIFTAKALNFFDEEKIFVDPQTFYPLMVKRDLNIWGKREKIIEEYFPQKGVVKITKEAGGKTSEQRIEKKGTIDNIYSFIYRYRTQGQFRMGDTLSLHLPTKEVILTLKEQTNIKAAGRQFEAYYMTSDPAQYKVWFDHSDQKIPLKINGAVGFGDTAMVMVSYKKGGSTLRSSTRKQLSEAGFINRKTYALTR